MTEPIEVTVRGVRASIVQYHDCGYVIVDEHDDPWSKEGFGGEFAIFPSPADAQAFVDKLNAEWDNARLIELAAQNPPQGEQLYPCVKCGKLRTKAEGGATFSHCESCSCWKQPPQGEPQPQEPVSMAQIAGRPDRGHHKSLAEGDECGYCKLTRQLAESRQEVERLEAAFAELIRRCRTSGRIVGYDSDSLDRAVRKYREITGEEP